MNQNNIRAQIISHAEKCLQAAHQAAGGHGGGADADAAGRHCRHIAHHRVLVERDVCQVAHALHLAARHTLQHGVGHIRPGVALQSTQATCTRRVAQLLKLPCMHGAVDAVSCVGECSCPISGLTAAGGTHLCAQVPQHQVVVGAIGDQLVALAHQPLAQRPGIGTHLPQ